MFDSHCHIQFNAYKNDFLEVISRCVEKNVVMNTVGTQKDTSKKAVEFAEKFDNVYATIGLHPIHLFPTHVDEEESSFVSREEDFDESYYDELAQSEKVIAVGECGIDLYHMPENKTKIEILEKQKEIFLKQVKFAQKHDLPLVIHVRDAHEEMINLLREFSSLVKEETEAVVRVKTTSPILSLTKERNVLSGVIHCYTSNWQNAQQYLDMGFYLGFTGVITFPPKKTDPKPQEELLEVVKNCPLDRMLVETDAPYLAPQAYRGKRCEPWMVEEVAKKIAEIREKSIDDVSFIVEKNTKDLFTRLKK
ncbi:MAG: TatD family hydrolase [Candidatus Magasanikbacteria bacterium]